MKAQHQLDCVELADVDYGVGLLFGLIFAPPPAILAEMNAHGVDLGELHGVRAPMLRPSAVYVISPAGKITMAQVDLEHITSVEPEMVLPALETAS